MIARASEIPDGFVLVEPNSPFMAAFGPLYERRDGDSFVPAFRVAEHHKNINNVAHGGVLTSFADMLLARALMWERQRYGVTVRLVTDYLGPAKAGDWVEGRSWITGGGNTIVFVAGEARCGRLTPGILSQRDVFGCGGRASGRLTRANPPPVRLAAPGLVAPNALVYPKLSRIIRGVAQPGSAAALGAAGRWFKSSRPDQVCPA